MLREREAEWEESTNENTPVRMDLPLSLLNSILYLAKPVLGKITVRKS